MCTVVYRNIYERSRNTKYMNHNPVQVNTPQWQVVASDAVSTTDGKSLSVELLSVGLLVLNIFSPTGTAVCGIFVGGDGRTVGDTLTGIAVGGRSCEGLLLVGLFVARGAGVVGDFVGDNDVGAAVGDNVVGATDVGEAVIGANVGI